MDADLELDESLSQSRPSRPDTPGIKEALRDLILDTELATQPTSPSIRKRAATALGVAMALLGIGAAAHAAGVLLPEPSTGDWGTEAAAVHLDIQLADGERCNAVYMVAPTETSAAKYSPEKWDEVWGHAVEYLATVEPESLASERVYERFRRSQDGPTSDVDVRLLAPAAELKARIDARLTQLNLPTDMLVMTAGNDCRPGPT